MTEIVAEVGLQHDGSLRDAIQYVRACAENGVDVVKFQCHLGDPNTSFRPGTEHYFPQDKTRADYWRRTGFWRHEWEQLKAECDDCGVEFLCTPFSVAAAEMLNPLVERWKIGSGQNQSGELFKLLADTKKPIIISTGDTASVRGIREEDLFRQAIHVLWEFGCRDISVLKCISKYPTPNEEAFRFVSSASYREFNFYHHYKSGTVSEPMNRCWGWSDHTGDILASIDAINYGAQIVELHICWHKKQGGPDVGSAVTVDQLADVAQHARRVDGERQKEAERIAELAREHAERMQGSVA